MSCGSFSSGPLSAGPEFVHPRSPLALTSLAKATELGVLTDDHWELIGCWQAQKDRDMVDGLAPISVSVNGKDFLVRHPDKAGNSRESNVHCETMMVNGADESWEEDESDPPGLCVVDTACRKTMHGEKWKQRFVKALNARGLSHQEAPSTQRFRGIGGGAQALSSDRFPVGIAEVCGEIESCCVPDEDGHSLTMLMSFPDLQRLGMHIHTAAMTCDIDVLGVKDHPLVITSRGHLAISLLDFPSHGHDGLSLDLWEAE